MIGQLPQVFKVSLTGLDSCGGASPLPLFDTNDVLVYYYNSMHIRLSHIPPEAAFALLDT
jgi:hypothetical protein